MRINSVLDVKCFGILQMCYVHNQWNDISCATLYVDNTADLSLLGQFTELLILSLCRP